MEKSDINQFLQCKKYNQVYEEEQLGVDHYIVPIFVAVGKVGSEISWNFTEHIHSSYEFVYIEKGTVCYTCDNKKFEVKEGDLYFIQPNQLHKELNSSKRLKFTYLRFKYSRLGRDRDRIIPEYYMADKQVIRNVNKKIVNLLEEIYIEQQNKQLGSKEIVEAMILQLIWNVRRELGIGLKEDAFENKNMIVDKAITYMKAHTHKKILLKEIAESCNVSSHYLSHVFKEVTDYSILKYIDKIKMEKAMIMLMVDNMNVNEIAEKLGYQDGLYFSKKFKKTYQASPTNFRKNKENKLIE